MLSCFMYEKGSVDNKFVLCMRRDQLIISYFDNLDNEFLNKYKKN
jgi:hypothetical protein